MEGDFRVDQWLVQPQLNSIVSPENKTVQLEPKVMEVLVCLAERPKEVLPKERIMKAVWPATFVTEDALTRSISEIRKALRDDAKDPHFIQTIPKRGYRLIATVTPLSDASIWRLRHQDAAENKAAMHRLDRGIGSYAPDTEETDSVWARLLTKTLSRAWVRLLAAAWITAMILAGWYVFIAPRIDTNAVPRGVSRQITSGSALQNQPAVSPDGSMVAYTSDASGNQDIWISDTRGGPPRQFTNHPADDFGASWFPDGSSLAFVSDRNGQPDIWKAHRFDGGAAVVLIKRALDPAISPDGSQIAFVSVAEPGRCQVAVASLKDLNSVRNLTTSRDGLWEQRNPAWSPDGLMICYWSWDGLWLIPSEGGPLRRLTTYASDQFPAWSADGRFVYFSSFRDGRTMLWRVPSRGGTPVCVTPGSGAESRPSVSRDGRILVFSTAEASQELILRDLKSGNESRFGGEDDSMPTFDPDACRIYFLSNRWGRFDLWAQQLSGVRPGGSARPLTDNQGIESHPTCSPDGRWIAYYRILGNRRDIWIAPTAGGMPRRISEGSINETHPAWSPDGTQLAFMASQGGSAQIWVRPIADGRTNGAAIQLTKGPQPYLLPAWSPDGSQIACITQVGSNFEVALVAVDRGAPPRIVTSGAQPQHVRWIRSSGMLMISGKWGGQRLELRAMRPEDGSVQQLTPPVFLGPGVFDVSYDGRLVVFCRDQARGSIWVREAQSRPF